MAHISLMPAFHTALVLLKYLNYYSSFLKLNFLLIITDQESFSMVFN